MKCRHAFFAVQDLQGRTGSARSASFAIRGRAPSAHIMPCVAHLGRQSACMCLSVILHFHSCSPVSTHEETKQSSRMRPECDILRWRGGDGTVDRALTLTAVEFNVVIDLMSRRLRSARMQTE